MRCGETAPLAHCCGTFRGAATLESRLHFPDTPCEEVLRP